MNVGISSRPLLDVADIAVRFGGVRAVDGVSLEISGAGILGLVGPNGSGKTTFLNALTGVVPARGSMRVDGRSVTLGRPSAARRAGLVRMYQAPQLCPNLTCLDNVLVGHADTSRRGLLAAWVMRRAMLRHERTRYFESVAALERVGLASRTDRRGHELTYGEQRMTELARAIVAKPRILLLDEPSAGLNDAETASLAGILRELARDGVTLVVIDHKIDFIDSLCDRVIVLESGRLIADGSPADVWFDPHVIDAYLGAGHDAAHS